MDRLARGFAAGRSWTVYITWDQYEANRRRMAANDKGREPGTRAARADTLLNRLARCGRCGRAVVACRSMRDFERLPETGAAVVKLSGIRRMARRARPPRGRWEFRYKPKAT